MARRPTGIAIALALGTAMTATIAWPVLRAPTEQTFGNEIVGRHHDSYTIMVQIAAGPGGGTYAQPVTDWLGWLFARVLDPVAAYNLLVLISFPFSMASAYALARYLWDSHAGALVAGIAFAFSPLHLAHAAYHPHVAQTHWLPIYFLALFALVDRPTWQRAVALAIAAGVLVLSNLYGGLIGAVMTPVAFVAYWFVRARDTTRWRQFLVPAATLAVTAAVGLAGIFLARPQAFVRPSPLAFEISDLTRYSARWWAYFVPPVSHPVFGTEAARTLDRAGITLGVLEQQVTLSYGLLILAAVAVVVAVWQWRARRAPIVLAIMAIGIAAAIVSIGPGQRHCGPHSWAPACLLYPVVPMFRSYARFGVVTHLTVALAAGVGAVWLAGRSRVGLLLSGMALTVATFEYWPLPWHAHDVLPTRGHRWLADRPEPQRTLDCIGMRPAEVTVPWLMKRDLTFLNPVIETCLDPQLAGRLAALGYTHVLSRRRDDTSPLAGDPPAGLVVVADLPDSRVFRVITPVPPVIALRSEGFFTYEHDGADWWRWMGPQGRWTVRNTTDTIRRVALSLHLAPIGGRQRLRVAFDGDAVEILELGRAVAEYHAGPWVVAPGDHSLSFEALDSAIRPSDVWGSPDTRLLAVSFRGGRWIDRTHDTRQ